jgi:hypothetical protein
MTSLSRFRPPRSWLLLLILLTGFGLRWLGLTWGQGYFYFGQGDGIAAYSVAVDYARGEAKAQYLGQPNYNHASKLPGILWTVFCFEGLRWGGSIKGVIVAIILLNTLTIYLVYLLATRTLGEAAALWAALFMATFPWMVFYSTGIYNPEVMPCLGALLALALWEVARQNRSWLIFWVPVLLLAMPQFHVSGLMLWPAALLLLLLTPVRLHFGWLAAGFLAGAALYLPYLRGDMANHWQNTLGFFAGGEPRQFAERFKALSAPLSFLVNWAPRWTRNAAEYRELGRACFGAFPLLLAVNLVSGVVAGLLLVGTVQILRPALRGIFRAPRHRFAQNPGFVFLAILTLVPLAAALVASPAFHTRYCLVLLPAMMSLVAGGAGWLLDSRLKRTFQVLVALTTAANLWLMPAMYHNQGARIENGPVFIPSFDRLEMVYQKLKAHAGPARGVGVDDADFLAGPARKDNVLRDAAAIRHYVEVREREAQMLSPIPAGGAPAVYRLELAQPDRPADTKVALQLQGIALVAE